MQQYTIVATSFNDEHEINGYLNNIMQQETLPVEVIIADGGSKDNTISIIEKFNETCKIPVRVVTNGRLNISQGYNLAIRTAITPYILITGIGNVYDINFAYQCLKKVDEDGSDLVYGTIKGVDKTKFSKLFNKSFLNGDKGEIQSIASNHGAMIKKSIFKKYGYFLENFEYAGEDTEFYLMLRNNNVKTTIAEKAIVFWKTPKDWKEFLKQRKNYVIAGLQLQTSKNKYYKYLILCISFVIAVLLLIKLNGYIFMTFVILGIIYFCYKEKSYSLQKSLILFVKKVSDMYFTIKYNKYSKVRYKVFRKKSN